MYYYSLDKSIESKFEIANVKETKQLIGLRSSEFLAYQFEVWEEIYGKIEKAIVPILGETSEKKLFNSEGIVFEFAKIKNDSNIQKFANKYGLLGIAGPTSETKEMYKQFKPEELPFEYSYFEPIQIWWYFIEKIRQNLKLYRALVNNHQGGEIEIEDNILRLEAIGEKSNFTGHYWVNWNDGSRTGIQLNEEEAEELDFVTIARRVLIQNIKTVIERGQILINPEIIETNKPPLGIAIIERKYTPYLITAIYNDFWKMISINQPVHICENPKCKLPFPKIKRQKYCSQACKQEHYRIRQKEK